MRDGANFPNPIKVIWPVQPSLQKYTSSRFPQISPTSQPVPARQEGRIAIVTDVGSECGGHGSARCADKIAGRALACERSAARQTSGTEAYGKTVWSWRPWLASSRRRFAKLNRAMRTIHSPATEARGIRLRGELGISRKTTVQGMPGCSGCTCMLVCAFLSASCTRDRGC